MPQGIKRRRDTNWTPEPVPDGRDVGQQYRAGVAPREGSAPEPMSPCGPQDVFFVRERVNLAGGAGPARGQVIATIRPQPGILYPGVWIRWGCLYPWLIESGVVTIRVMVNQAFPYPIAERFATPRWPILLPQCWTDNAVIRVVAFWTDPTVTTFNRIPVWAELALGTYDPPNFDDDSRNRVRRRIADILPIVVLPGAALASISPGIIRPTAGKLWMQTSPVPAPTPASKPQFSFATTRGSGIAGNIAGVVGGTTTNSPVEIEVDDLRDVFLGDPLLTSLGPTTVLVHREVWE